MEEWLYSRRRELRSLDRGKKCCSRRGKQWSTGNSRWSSSASESIAFSEICNVSHFIRRIFPVKFCGVLHISKVLYNIYL